MPERPQNLPSSPSRFVSGLASRWPQFNSSGCRRKRPLNLPGDLCYEAHAALIRDFDALVQDDEGDGERFTIGWRDGHWVKSSRGGR